MATINDIGIPGVGTGILQPKIKNRWRVTFAGLGNGIDTQPLSMQIITFDRPQLSFEEVPLHRYNSVAWVAGKHTWAEQNFVVEDDIAGTATNVLQQQLQSQQLLIGAGGPWLATAPEGSFYKFATFFDQLDGGTTVLETWIMEGCWLKSVNYDGVDYSSSDPIKLQISMRFDHARQNIPNYGEGPGSALGGGSAGTGSAT